MTDEMNTYGQKIGPALPGWTKRPLPPHTALTGRYCRLEKFDPIRHAKKLYTAFAEVPDGRDWTYLPVGPFADELEYIDYMQKASLKTDPLHHAILVNELPIGSAALMRIDPDNGVIEVGYIAYPRCIRTMAIAGKF